MGTQKQSSKEKETNIGILTGTKLDRMLCKQVFVFNTTRAPQMLITSPHSLNAEHPAAWQRGECITLLTVRNFLAIWLAHA